MQYTVLAHLNEVLHSFVFLVTMQSAVTHTQSYTCKAIMRKTAHYSK